ncbi:MAG: hypothetical protein NTW44_07100 [Nitrospirae bacterium]|nr:hypothetical protein [Nitrospirota bacterium]
MRIIIPKKEIQKDKITISGEKARYLISVLRCGAGDELQVFNGEGSFYKSKVESLVNSHKIKGFIFWEERGLPKFCAS